MSVHTKKLAKVATFLYGFTSLCIFTCFWSVVELRMHRDNSNVQAKVRSKKVKINLLHEFMQEFERRFQEIIFFPIFESCQNGSNGKCTSLICKVEGSWRVRFYLFLTPSLRICCELNRILNDNISQTVWMCHYGFNGFIVKIRAFNARTYVHFFIYV